MLNGYYLIHPMGWDAFGLPAENYAIKMGVHPEKSTAENIANIKRQIKEIAAVYDWDMEVNTTDPNFYKWTQWIFVKMFRFFFVTSAPQRSHLPFTTSSFARPVLQDGHQLIGISF